MFWRFASRQGYQLLREGKWDSALKAFERLCDRFPRNPMPFFEAGKLQFKKGEFPKAQANLVSALERTPTPEIISGILEMSNWWMISSPNFFNTSPVFSPDGKQLLFCSARQDTNGDGKIDGSDRAAVYLADVESTAVTEVVNNRYHNSAPVWSPDGQSILYFSSRPLGDRASDHADLKFQHLLMRRLDSREDTLLVPASLNPRYPVFTRDGKYLIVCTVDTTGGASGLSLVELETQKRKPLTSHAWEHTYPQISPDGKFLMYVCWKESSGSGIQSSAPTVHLRNLDTNRDQVIVSDQFASAYPRFSPEGDSIVYLSRRRDTNGDGRIDHLDNFGIYTLRLSDRRESCIAGDAHHHKFPTWTGDGKSILALSHWADQENKPSWQNEDYFEFKGIYRYALAGEGKPYQVVSDKFFGSRFCETSPQGHSVAYVSWRPRSNRGLYIADYQDLPSISQLRGFIQNNLS